MTFFYLYGHKIYLCYIFNITSYNVRNKYNIPFQYFLPCVGFFLWGNKRGKFSFYHLEAVANTLNKGRYFFLSPILFSCHFGNIPSARHRVLVRAVSKFTFIPFKTKEFLYDLRGKLRFRSYDMQIGKFHKTVLRFVVS